MEFVKVMKIRERLCRKHRCHECPLGKLANDKGYEGCSTLMKRYPELAEECLVEWNKEHPIKTFTTDFFEKFPNAPKDEYGFPKACPKNLGYIKSCPNYPCLSSIAECRKCWLQLMEE